MRYVLVFLILLGSIKYLVGMEEPTAKRQCIKADQQTLDEAFFLAVIAGNEVEMKELVKRGANVNQADTKGNTPLYEAAKEGKKDIVELLLNVGADVNKANREDATLPLHWAVAYAHAHKDIVKLLLKAGADINAQSRFGYTALYVAVLNGHKDIIELLLNANADINKAIDNGSTPLHAAVEKGNKNLVKLLLDAGVDVNAQDKRGEAPLSGAAQKNYKDIVELLLARGANINAKDAWDHRTPLYFLLRSFMQETPFSLSTIKSLQGYRACIDPMEKQCAKLLKKAVYHLHPEMVEFLIKQGVNAYTTFSSNEHNYEHLNLFSVLQLAADDIEPEGLERKKIKRILEILLTSGVQWNKEDEEETEFIIEAFKREPLIVAILEGNLDQLKDAAILIVDNHSLNKAMCYAVAQGKSELVAFLLERGVFDIHKALECVKSILAQSAFFAKNTAPYERIKSLLFSTLSLVDEIIRRPELRAMLIKGLKKLPKELAIKVNPDYFLFEAIRHGRADGTLDALQAKGDPNAVDKNGVPILNLVAFYPQIQEGEKIVSLLLKYGARPTQQLLHALVVAPDTDKRNAIMALIFQAMEDASYC
jgi:ankyrin repeat protein